MTFTLDPIDAALRRERPAQAPAGWPTHRHRARIRRRLIVARRRARRRDARRQNRPAPEELT